jgi:hypothetical protein
VESQTVEQASASEGDELEQRAARLERANEELRRANSALAREQLGKRDAAAASMLIRLQQAEKRADKLEHSISWRVTAPLRILKPAFKPLVAWLHSVGERLRLRRGRRP